MLHMEPLKYACQQSDTCTSVEDGTNTSQKNLHPGYSSSWEALKASSRYSPSKEASPHHHSTTQQNKPSPVQTAFLCQHHPMGYVLSCLLRLSKSQWIHNSHWGLIRILMPSVTWRYCSGQQIQASSTTTVSQTVKNGPIQTWDRSLHWCYGHNHLPS